MRVILFAGFAALASVLVLAGCSEPSPKMVPYQKTRKSEKLTINNPKFRFDPMVDILFVIDDSGSMERHQQRLAQNIRLFTDNFGKLKVLDYHIGVVSTDMFDQMDSGRLKAVRGNPIYIDKNTPNGFRILAENMIVGTNGSATEKSFDPVYAALSQPLVSTFNSGFYRKEAHLAIIFITDAEDQSTLMNANSLYDFLVREKDNDPSKILVYGAYVPSNVQGCDRDAWDAPARLEDFFRIAKGDVFSLCDPLYGEKLAAVGKNLVGRINRVVYLSRSPVISTIEVSYGSQIIPNDLEFGWSYDPSLNAIIFGKGLILSENEPAGTGVEINFTAASHF